MLPAIVAYGLFVLCHGDLIGGARRVKLKITTGFRGFVETSALSE
jgi:hypothetical protein